ncbi:hypothetical protein [Xanthomonas hortorum]|uniref:Uncharacterized protein n=1 Tax=Xanthomonas hortorum TaxID=56454 RepID=A0AA47IA47_9XANT|nr:hypothetical protein [Xanthomonas hortorum]WAH64486.1 hypothetical protein OEG85_00300 [Xanthomonas hortorum]
MAKASGADYFSVRRMRLNGVANRSKNAKKLCVFFNLDGSQADVEMKDAGRASLQRLIYETWDGTPAHKQFLEEVLAVASRFKVRLR